MLKSILVSILSAGLFFNPPIPKITAEVDRTEDGDYAVTYVYVDRGNREDYYKFDIPQEDYNERKADGEELEVTTSVGRFVNKFTSCDIDGKESIYYQFKSYDNDVLWALTEDDIDFEPVRGKSYVLAYYDNGTKNCPDEPHECNGEEYKYDDIFLGVYDL